MQRKAQRIQKRKNDGLKNERSNKHELWDIVDNVFGEVDPCSRTIER